MFDDLMADTDPAVHIVTTRRGDERSGCLVGFLSQCSIDPLRVMVWLSHANHTTGLVGQGSILAVHLPREGDEVLARLFAEETGDEIDKFDRCAWSDGPGGVPVLDECDWYAGRVIDQIDGGDHTGFLVDLVQGGRCTRKGERPLRLHTARDFDPGHDA